MKSIRSLTIKTLLLLTCGISASVNATIVQFQTSLGNFEVNLFDETTPKTVENFLAYINNESYKNSIIHRSVPGFVIQGGGYSYQQAWPVTAISTFAAVDNEPVYANVKGTIAMAKLPYKPNSATSQWFINLADNSTYLDGNNGGFTVFGTVVGDGMAIIEQIASLPVSNQSSINSALNELPLQNYTQGETPDDSNLIMVFDVQIIDAASNTASNLSPTPNTYQEEIQEQLDSSGGGAMGFSLLLLLLLNRRK